MHIPGHHKFNYCAGYKLLGTVHRKITSRALNSIGELRGRFMIRVGMMNPATVKGILDDRLDAFASDRIFNFVHLPVQSGSDAILDGMGEDIL